MNAKIERDDDAPTPPPLTWRDFKDTIDREELDEAGRRYLDLLEMRSEQLDTMLEHTQGVLRSLSDFAARITGEVFTGDPKSPQAVAMLERAVGMVEQMLGGGEVVPRTPDEN